MDLLNDKIGSLYQKFLWPSLFAALVTTIYSFVDTIAIGRGVGPDGAAASAVIYPIFGVATLFGVLCGIGGSVRLSKARGEGEPEKANAYYTASLLLAVVMTAVAWLLVVLFKREIFAIFGASDSLMPLVLEYGDWIVWTFPVFILSAYFTCMIRCDGAPNHVMAAVAAGGIFNVFGDWFLVFPMDMGMAGAALATVGGTVIQLVVMLCYLFQKRCQLKLVRPFRFAGAMFKSLAAGFSASVLEFAFIVLTCILNNQIMRYGGEVALAVFGVVLSCSGMFQHIYTGVGQAIQPIAASNYGAGLFPRIFSLRRISLITVIGMGVGFTALGELFPIQIIQFFMDTTPEVLEATPEIVRIYFLSFLFMGVNIWATSYFQAIMRTAASAVLTILRGLVVSSILLYLLPVLMGGVQGVWWAMVFTEAIVAVITLLWVKHTHDHIVAEQRLYEEEVS